MAKGTIGRAAPAKVKTAPPSTGKKAKADAGASLTTAAEQKAASAAKKASAPGKTPGAGKVSAAGKVSGVGKVSRVGKVSGAGKVPASGKPASKNLAAARQAVAKQSAAAKQGPKRADDKPSVGKAPVGKTRVGKTPVGKAVSARPAASKQVPMMRAAPKQPAKTPASPAKPIQRKAAGQAPAAKIVAAQKAERRRGSTRVAVPIPAARRGRKPPAPRTPTTQTPASGGKQVFTVSHLDEADFKAEGLRTYAQYRDLGIAAATAGLCQAHVIRFVPPCTDEVRKRHVHQTDLQLVYVLKGWMKNEFEGYGEQMMSVGSCWLQPTGIKHTVLDYSADCEVLEIIVPADFKTEEIS